MIILLVIQWKKGKKKKKKKEKTFSVAYCKYVFSPQVPFIWGGRGADGVFGLWFLMSLETTIFFVDPYKLTSNDNLAW